MEHTILTYENRELMMPLVEAAKRLCKPGEFVIWRGPFRWRKGEEDIIPNCYEMFSLESVCLQAGFTPVHDFNHFAIVRN